MPKVAIDTLPAHDGPDAAVLSRGPLGRYEGRAISRVAGLEHLGANLDTLMPGSAPSHRRCHDRTDELVVVLSGALMLADEDGETPLAPGEIAVFPAGVRDGPCLINRPDSPATFLMVGTRDPEDRSDYADLDLMRHPGGRLTRRDGTPADP